MINKHGSFWRCHSLECNSLKAMLLRSTALTAGRDFLRQGRGVGGFVLRIECVPTSLSLTAGGFDFSCHASSPLAAHNP